MGEGGLIRGGMRSFKSEKTIISERGRGKKGGKRSSRLCMDILDVEVKVRMEPRAGVRGLRDSINPPPPVFRKQLISR